MQDGIRQVVSLAAGMDGRAVRLKCPPGTRWYELDMPEMVAFKDALIARAGMTPTCNWHRIGADLAADWHGELQKAGFDRRKPSAWLIEGLLMYLTEETADHMLAEVTSIRTRQPAAGRASGHQDDEGGRPGCPGRGQGAEQRPGQRARRYRGLAGRLRLAGHRPCRIRS